MGGLVKFLIEIPINVQCQKFYENFLIGMCEKIFILRGKDLYWQASLLDPKNYLNPETFGTWLYVYALSYGINSGLLSKYKFLPFVLKGWEALEKALFPDGKLGWVLPVGEDPCNTSKKSAEVYGIGAFLLAGSEVYKLGD
jgi:unsaturated rhamnogalacturonyl hydrolase